MGAQASAVVLCAAGCFTVSLISLGLSSLLLTSATVDGVVPPALHLLFVVLGVICTQTLPSGERATVAFEIFCCNCWAVAGGAFVAICLRANLQSMAWATLCFATGLFVALPFHLANPGSKACAFALRRMPLPNPTLSFQQRMCLCITDAEKLISMKLKGTLPSDPALDIYIQGLMAGIQTVGGMQGEPDISDNEEWSYWPRSSLIEIYGIGLKHGAYLRSTRDFREYEAKNN
ncbi:hypothetical protein [Variovorax ginsengisoli]|uniref:Uncharacterized protein n=1 Tax=Variovorax ginsengisoli TaxID=363844 RepID=A0ABT9S6R6_9BURK|nr:hypothetical protein [Variovorax ginsengisoli]MDP9900055.1 hypothetical protein [Variovorax ginsengisoli]